MMPQQFDLLKASAITEIQEDLENIVSVYRDQAELAARAAGAPLVTVLTEPVPIDGAIALLQTEAGTQVWEVRTGAWVQEGWLGVPVFRTITAMAAATGFIEGQYVDVEVAFNGQKERFKRAATSSLTANGATVVTATGMTVGRFISTRTEYADFDEFIGDRRIFAAGTVASIRGIDAGYTATDGAGNMPQANAGGQNFICRSEWGSVSAMGAKGDGVADDDAAFAAAISAFGAIKIPEGTFNVAGPFDVRGKFISGAGKYVSILKTPGVNQETVLFHNTKATASLPWGSGVGVNLNGFTIEGSWDGSTVLDDANWDGIAGLVKWAAGSKVTMTEVKIFGSFGHGASFFRLGYSYFIDCDFTANAHNGLHLEAPSGDDSITSTFVRGGNMNSNSRGGGVGNMYLKNGVGVYVNHVTFEDSNAGVYLDGNDNRDVTIMFNHAETCTDGILHFVGSGQNTVVACNFVDAASAPQRTNPAFQKVFAFANHAGINAIETGLTSLEVLTLLQSGSTTSAEAAKISVQSSTAAHLEAISPHQGYLAEPISGVLLQQENNQFNGGARIAAIAEGSVNEDKLGILFQVRKGISNVFSSVMHLTTSGALLPWVDNDQDLGSRNFFDGSGSVSKRWKNGYFSGVLSTGEYTVSTLPANPGTGARTYVTDATLPTYLGALTGGGTVICPVFYNGSAWVSA